MVSWLESTERWGTSLQKLLTEQLGEFYSQKDSNLEKKTHQGLYIIARMLYVCG